MAPLCLTSRCAAALQEEATPLARALGLHLDPQGTLPGPAPCYSYSGSCAGLRVHLVANGLDRRFGVDSVGTGPAGLACYLALLTFLPDLLLASGTAGGFRAQGCRVGETYLSSGFVFHDRRDTTGPVRMLPALR